MQRLHIDSSICESDCLADVLQRISFNSVLLLDLDNTLIESSAAFIIGALQDIGIPVIGITARDICLANTTFRQLGKGDISFSTSADSSVGTELERNGDQYGTFYRGIIFCGGRKKSDALSVYLECINQKPEHIVMVDDKQKHLQDVYDLATKYKIPFSGLRYNRLDTKVIEFDLEVAHQQLNSLKDRLHPQIVMYVDKLQISDFGLFQHPQIESLFADENELKHRSFY